MIKVLGLTNHRGDWSNGEGWSGGGYHRILTPLGNMPEVEGFVSDAIVPEHKVDVLLYNRVSHYDKDWDEIKAYLGCKVILDLDDYGYGGAVRPVRCAGGDCRAWCRTAS